MTELINRLTAESEAEYNGGGCDGKIYDMAQIRATAQRCIDLDSAGGLLAVDDRDTIVSFAVFEMFAGPATKGGVVVAGAKMQLVFYGSGPSGPLRELRHTHWGEDGYIFYPHGALICAAFAALKEWFDCD